MNTPRTPKGSLVRTARAQAELKFSYVVTAQNYGKHKSSSTPTQQEKAADILYLMHKYVFVPLFNLCSCSLSTFSGKIIRENRRMTCYFWSSSNRFLTDICVHFEQFNDFLVVSFDRPGIRIYQLLGNKNLIYHAK